MKTPLYRLCPSNPKAHLFSVELHLATPNPKGQVLRLPAWIPGSYKIRDFARHIVSLTVTDEKGEPVEVIKLDKQSWQCAPTERAIVIRYEVYAWELSVRAAHLDQTHGYFNGACLFLMAEGFEEQACIVELQAPDKQQILAPWRVATTLTPESATPFDFGRYQATDYQDLIDHPVEMGNFKLISFAVNGVPHDLAISGRCHLDPERIRQDLTKICAQQIGLFDELPVQRYLFLLQVTRDGYGGLEHCASSSLLCGRDMLPQPGMAEVTDRYCELLGLCSHEYFHLWHVKRIRPLVFATTHLQSEVYTRLLWVFEGITSYYDELALVRSGCISTERYLDLLAQLITRVQRGSGRLKQTLSDSSFDAWTRFYQQDENAPNAIVSYYSKGALVALALDLHLRLATGGAHSLDTVMRALWQERGEGITEDGFEQLAMQVTGLDLTDFFAQTVRSTDELQLADLLADFAITMRWRPAAHQKDKGGVLTSASSQPGVALGAAWQAEGQDVRLTQVFDQGAAQQAGLAPGDCLLALDGVRVTANTLEQQLAQQPIDTAITVHLFRGDELLTLPLHLQVAPADRCELRFAPEADAEAIERYQHWLA